MSDLHQTLMSITQHSFISGSVALGVKLGLFEALAAVSCGGQPSAAVEVAEKAGCKERYVKEWLSCMACAGIIEVTDDEKFYIKQENEKDLVGETRMLALPALMQVPEYYKNYHNLAKCSRRRDPMVRSLAYSDFNNFYQQMQSMSEAMHAKHLLPDILPLIHPSLPSRLSAGGMRVLDVGCGAGFHTAMLAEHFPLSTFVGMDISAEAIAMAKKKKSDDGHPLLNLSFVEMDAGAMSADWSDSFDFVCIFDACHDQMRPDLCLAEVYRVLKPGGLFMMLEINGTSSTKKDKATLGGKAAMMYSRSLFHCLPVGSNCKDAVCAGAMWGREMATAMLRSAGFQTIQTHAPQFLQLNIVYVCTK